MFSKQRQGKNKQMFVVNIKPALLFVVGVKYTMSQTVFPRDRNESFIYLPYINKGMVRKHEQNLKTNISRN